MGPVPAQRNLPVKSLPLATTAWILILLVCFALQQIVVVHFGKPYDAYLAMSGYGIKSGHLWELLTLNLLHAGWLHLGMNVPCLWFVGRAVERGLGWRRLVGITLPACLVGALLQGAVGVAGFLLPESIESVAAFLRDRYGGPLYGASVPLCAWYGVWCHMPFHGVLASERSAGLARPRFLWLAAGAALVLVVVPTTPDLPHLAHLGAMLAGAWLSRRPARS